MLSFLVLVSTSGQPLPPSAVARCTRPPDDLVFQPVAATQWRSVDGHVIVAAWADRRGMWHVGQHGCTVTTAAPWALYGRSSSPSGPAFLLTEQLGDRDDRTALRRSTGAAVVARVRPDGSGQVAAPTTGGGIVHVARGDGLLAVSDRATLAARGTGGSSRRSDLPGLVRGGLLDGRSPVVGVDRLPPGAQVLLRGRDGPRTFAGRGPWSVPDEGSTDELARSAADEVTRLVEQAAALDGRRLLDLADDRGSLAVAAALSATGTARRFDVRATAGPAAAAARVLVGAAGGELVAEQATAHGGELVDARVRAAVGRHGAIVAVPPHGGALADVLAESADVRVVATPGGPLTPDAGVRAEAVLRSEARAVLEEEDAAWVADRGRAVDSPPARAMLGVLDRALPLRQRAVADLSAGARVLDPLGGPAVAMLALHAAAHGRDPLVPLLAALDPSFAPRAERTHEVAGPAIDADARDARWRDLAPVLEAVALGQAREQLAPLVDLDEVAVLTRRPHAPDDDTGRALHGVLTLGVWAANADIHAPAAAAAPSRPVVELHEQQPTLVTGVTSASLLDLTGVQVPIDEREVDAMLGVAVDREVRDLVLRVLLAVDAAPGHLPADLDDRLTGDRVAHLAAPARALLTRRGGTLVDPRLALTLPFWRAHVRSPRVVLVAERPPDLAERSSASLPTSVLLGWWVDAMTAAAATPVDLRVVDPGDLTDTPPVEAVGWEGLVEEGPTDEGEDLMRLVRTVDSLVREVELEAARPLLRTVRGARLRDPGHGRRSASPAQAPLRVVDELWQRAVEADVSLASERADADELRQRLTDLEDELATLRARRGFRAAWQVLRGES